MSELNRQQHVELGGSFETDPLYGGFIDVLAGLYMPGKSVQVNGNHYAAMANMLDAMARRFGCVGAIYPYKDSADTDAQFSVQPGNVLPGGVLSAYAGETALGDLTTGDNKIWLDLSDPTTIVAAFGAAWPLTPHIMLATINMPATGPWLPQHLTALTGAHALNPIGTGIHTVEKAFTYQTSSPLKISAARPGGRVLRAYIKIDTAFDGTTPTLEIGDTGDPDRLMAAAGNDPKTVQLYSATPFYQYAVQTDINLTITPDGSTAGAGVVLLEIA